MIFKNLRLYLLTLAFVFFSVQSERKGSCDSLTSQRSSDSQSSTTVRDTLHVAKKQIQALMGSFFVFFKLISLRLLYCQHFIMPVYFLIFQVWAKRLRVTLICHIVTVKVKKTTVSFQVSGKDELHINLSLDSLMLLKLTLIHTLDVILLSLKPLLW